MGGFCDEYGGISGSVAGRATTGAGMDNSKVSNFVAGNRSCIGSLTAAGPSADILGDADASMCMAIG